MKYAHNANVRMNKPLHSMLPLKLVQIYYHAHIVVNTANQAANTPFVRTTVSSDLVEQLKFMECKSDHLSFSWWNDDVYMRALLVTIIHLARMMRSLLFSVVVNGSFLCVTSKVWSSITLQKHYWVSFLHFFNKILFKKVTLQDLVCRNCLLNLNQMFACCRI